MKHGLQKVNKNNQFSFFVFETKTKPRPDTLLSDIWFQSIDYFDIKHTHTHTQKPKSV